MKQETENKLADFIIGFALAVWILSMLAGCQAAPYSAPLAGSLQVGGR